MRAAPMPALDRLLRLLFTTLAAAFAVTGLLFFCFPNATVGTLNAAGRPLGFPPAPASPPRFWPSLAVAFPIGAADTTLVETLARYFARLHPLGPAGLRVLLRAIEYGTAVFERTRPFSRLDPAARERALAAWETSRLGPRRQLVASVKLLGLLHFYERPETWPGISYDDGHLRRKLLAG